MTQIHPIVLILLLEVLAVTSIISICWFTTSLRRARDEKRALLALFHRVNQEAERRVDEVRDYFFRVGYDESQVDRLAEQCDKGLTAFYRTFAIVYRKRDSDELAGFDREVETMLSLLRPEDSPSPPLTAEVSEPALILTDDTAERKVAFLEDKNRRLAEELQITKATLQGLMDEYAEMFDSDNSSVSLSSKLPPAFTQPTPETTRDPEVSDHSLDEDAIEMATGDELFERLQAHSK